jgi:hypothetical protein
MSTAGMTIIAIAFPSRSTSFKPQRHGGTESGWNRVVHELRE